MRLIDVDKFKQEISVQAYTGNISVEKANMLCKIIDMQPEANEETSVISVGCDDIYTEWFKCKCCGKENIFSTSTYCPDCGRRIIR